MEAATAHTVFVTSHMDAVTVHIEAATALSATVTFHIEVVTSHTATAIAHTVPGTIKPPFEPTATAHENGEAILIIMFHCNLQWRSFTQEGKRG